MTFTYDHLSSNAYHVALAESTVEVEVCKLSVPVL